MKRDDALKLLAVLGFFGPDNYEHHSNADIAEKLKLVAERFDNGFPVVDLPAIFRGIAADADFEVG